MAVLCPGVQYGLSSQQNFGENKDLIFVKLTDSALRAIEDYIKNQVRFSFKLLIISLSNTICCLIGDKSPYSDELLTYYILFYKYA